MFSRDRAGDAYMELVTISFFFFHENDGGPGEGFRLNYNKELVKNFRTINW